LEEARVRLREMPLNQMADIWHLRLQAFGGKGQAYCWKAVSAVRWHGG
jgi:hypothetical protein